MQPIQASQFEDLFEKKLHLYDSDLQLLAGERKEQEQLISRVIEANGAFMRARRDNNLASQGRETALQDLENGYLKYREIISNIEVGRKFYNDLARIVARFRDDCKAAVHQRKMEARQMESYVPTIYRLTRNYSLLTTS